MEQRVAIKSFDGKTIYGILDGPLSQPLVVLVHGLSSHANHIVCHNAVAFFNKRGFSVFRINLYSPLKNARALHETTLQVHGKDIDSVLNYLKKRGVEQIFMAGHSYGFPSILCTKERSFRAIVSWDGSLLPHRFFNKLPRSKDITGRILKDGTWKLIGEDMIKEAQTLSTEKLFRSLNVPIKFIVAEARGENNHAEAKKMSKMLAVPKDLVVIKKASHNFVEAGVLDSLYEETLSWFKKYL